MPRTFALLLVLFASPALAADPLAEAVEKVIDGKDYAQAHWGVLVTDAKTGAVLYERNPGKLFTPASTTKLYSCSAALLAYGADHRFVTPVHARGRVNGDGVLRGDLILVASGDLAFGGRAGPDGTLEFRDHDHTYANSGQAGTELTKGDPLAALKDLAKQLKDGGLKEVTREVLIDDRLYTAARGTGSGPDAVSPIMLNDNVVDITITPADKAGEPAKVVTRPVTAAIQVDAEVATGGKSQSPSIALSSQAAHQFGVRGRVPAGSPAILRIYPIVDPAAFARTCFIECLRAEGIRVAAPLLRAGTATLPDADDYAEMPTLAKHTSAPLGEMLKVTLKVSNNLYASALPCLVAAKKGKKTLEEGLREQRRLLKDLGVPVETISFGSGAGGGAADAVTPEATVMLLRGLAKRDDWAKFKSWLPVLGVDGTLEGIVGADSPARGKALAKTGTLSWNDNLNDRVLLRSKALAGTMTTKGGRELLFALFVNDVPLPAPAGPTREGKVLGRLCEILHDLGD